MDSEDLLVGKGSHKVALQSNGFQYLLVGKGSPKAIDFNDLLVGKGSPELAQATPKQ